MSLVARSPSLASSIVVVGVFEVAREIHALSPADRVIVMALVECLKQSGASQSTDVDTPSLPVVLPLRVPLLG
jgi:hypothetical protein